MKKEGRYISEDDYERIRAAEGLMLPQGYGVAPSIRPKQMTLKQLEDGFRWMTAHIYSREGFVGRVRRMFVELDKAPADRLLRHRAWRLSLEEMKIVYRLFAYYRKTRGNERKLWNEVLWIGLTSRFPQKTAMLAWLLLS
jgi:hypothetical protein